MVLENVTLAAIVRDEIMNPAGGIRDFLDSTMPFVEAGVVVDTGSVDGTWEALHEYRKVYGNLQTHKIEFNGFDKSRNFSLEKVKTKYALVLDADERITREGFGVLEKTMEDYPRRSYNFTFKLIRPDPDEDGFTTSVLNPRLFEVYGMRCAGVVYETLSYEYSMGHDVVYNNPFNIKVPNILHFTPEQKYGKKKRESFYRKFAGKYDGKNPLVWLLARVMESIDVAEDPRNLSLRNLSFYDDLRRYNPRREDYR